VAAQKRIMVIDYYQAFLDLMLEVLPEAGYEVITQLDGDLDVTYKAVVTQQPQQPIDLIILDLPLQKRDEAETLLTLLRLNAVTKDIPVILCSADYKTLKDKAARLESLGCCVLHKPFNLDELEATIRKGLGED
jgi:DNA-binding response OmpR family regulator